MFSLIREPFGKEKNKLRPVVSSAMFGHPKPQFFSGEFLPAILRFSMKNLTRFLFCLAFEPRYKKVKVLKFTIMMAMIGMHYLF